MNQCRKLLMKYMAHVDSFGDDFLADQNRDLFNDAEWTALRNIARKAVKRFPVPKVDCVMRLVSERED